MGLFLDAKNLESYIIFMTNLTNIPDFLLVSILFGYSLLVIRIPSIESIRNIVVSLIMALQVPALVLVLSCFKMNKFTTDTFYSLIALFLWLWIAEIESEILSGKIGCKLKSC